MYTCVKTVHTEEIQPVSLQGLEHHWGDKASVCIRENPSKCVNDCWENVWGKWNTGSPTCQSQHLGGCIRRADFNIRQRLRIAELHETLSQKAKEKEIVKE